MEATPLIIERTYNATPETVWAALTEPAQIRQWYFKLDDFKAMPGFEFSFVAGPEHQAYLHRCKVVEVIPNKKLVHTWQYGDIDNVSVVTWELFAEGDKTRVQLTHTGLEGFPAAQDKNFARESFLGGWTHILGTDLMNYLESKPAWPCNL